MKPVTLRLSTHHPADVSRSVGSRLVKEEIEKATNGLVKIDIYYSESLTKGREVLEAVKTKVVDIGDVNPAYYPGQLPVHAGLLVYTNSPPKYSQKAAVMQKMYAKYPLVLREIEQYNQKVLWQYFLYSLNLSSTKPVKSKVAQRHRIFPRLKRKVSDFGGSEDFTHLMRRVQSKGGKATYLMLGSTLAGNHHTQTFDFDETCLIKGVEILARTALEVDWGVGRG